MTDAEIDNLWLEAFKAAKDDGRVRQRFAELCYQKGAAEMKKRCVEVCKDLANRDYGPYGVDAAARDAAISMECAAAICFLN
jgi:hypothetical protein